MWVVLGESVTGTSHRAGNTPCQDACRFACFGPTCEFLVMVAADGAGSASHADKGAALACDEFVRRVKALEPDALATREHVSALFADVHNALIAEAERLGVRPREVACTAVLAIAGPTNAVFAQIGDGAIVTGSGTERRVVFWPEPTEYVNATDFLTDAQFAERIQFEATQEPVLELAILSDGLQRLALDFADRVPHPPFFGPFFKELQQVSNAGLLSEPLRTLLDSDRINQRTDDDKTLMLAVRRP